MSYDLDRAKRAEAKSEWLLAALLLIVLTYKASPDTNKLAFAMYDTARVAIDTASDDR